MTPNDSRQSASPGLSMAIDYGPLIVFFAVNFLAPQAPMMRLVASVTNSLDAMDQLAALVIAKVIVATTAFVIATIAAMIVSQIKLGRISPMLWISGVLVLLFGGLTVYFRDPRFIQMKPTIVYLLFALVLGFGLLTGRQLLQQLLSAAYPGLNARGWKLLTINWAIFFAAMALVNELVWRMTSWDFWVGFKLWGAVPLTLIFAVANIPMLLKNGLQAVPSDAPVPPEG